MRYFTKSWYDTAHGACLKARRRDEFKAKREEYAAYFQTIEDRLPDGLRQLSMRECLFLHQKMEDGNLHMEFNPYSGTCCTTEIVFANAVLLEDEKTPHDDAMLFWEEQEIYLLAHGFELHILFTGLHAPKQMILQTGAVTLINSYIRNRGTCGGCGADVSNPRKPGFIHGCKKGRYRRDGADWLCYECLQKAGEAL